MAEWGGGAADLALGGDVAAALGHVRAASGRRARRVEAYRAECRAVAAAVARLGGQTRHAALVPYGRMAFMDGELVHTGALVVRMADGFLVERTAEQALELLERRAGTDLRPERGGAAAPAPKQVRFAEAEAEAEAEAGGDAESSGAAGAVAAALEGVGLGEAGAHGGAAPAPKGPAIGTIRVQESTGRNRAVTGKKQGQSLFAAKFGKRPS